MSEYIERELAIKECGRFADYTAWSIMNGIEAIPTASIDPEAHWIPASEELPPSGENVLCWYEYFRFGSYNSMYQTFGIGYQYNGFWGGEVSNGQNAKVLAWMPLPKPPQMGGGAK